MPFHLAITLVENHTTTENLLSIHRSTSVVTVHLSHLPNAVVTRLAPLQLVQSSPLVHPPFSPPVAAIHCTTHMIDTIKTIIFTIGTTPIGTAITNTTITPATTFPVPRKLRHSLRRGEFVVLADLLFECLVLSGGCTKYSSHRKAARTRPITGIDTWLEAWRCCIL